MSSFTHILPLWGPSCNRLGSCLFVMKPFAESFYKSQAWKKCRAAYAKYRGGLCEKCLANGIVTPGVIVHHKIVLTPYNIHDPEVTTSFSNLELLCRDCHAQEHGSRSRRYQVDEAGRVVAK